MRIIFRAAFLAFVVLICACSNREEVWPPDSQKADGYMQVMACVEGDSTPYEVGFFAGGCKGKVLKKIRVKLWKSDKDALVAHANEIAMIIDCASTRRCRNTNLGTYSAYLTTNNLWSIFDMLPSEGTKCALFLYQPKTHLLYCTYPDGSRDFIEQPTFEGEH